MSENQKEKEMFEASMRILHDVFMEYPSMALNIAGFISANIEKEGLKLSTMVSNNTLVFVADGHSPRIAVESLEAVLAKLKQVTKPDKDGGPSPYIKSAFAAARKRQ